MNKKELLALGIEDEDLAQKIIVMHGKDIEKIKSDLEKFQTDHESVNAQLKEANELIEGFKAMDVDGIKQAADEWKEKAEKIAQEAQQQVEALKYDHALENALRSAKAKNPKAVKALLDTDKIKLTEDGSLDGIEDQLKTIATENDYLFETDEPTPKIVSRTQNKGVVEDSMMKAARKGANLPTNY